MSIFPAAKALQTVRKLVVVALITAVVCELALRMVGFQPYVAEAFVWQHDKLLGWSHKPEAQGMFSKIAFKQQIQINSKGLRERELAYEKPATTKRVVVIGDSMVVGFEVPLEKVFPRVAEAELLRAGQTVEFINGGCRGYGTDQALLWLQGEGVKYKPDVVLYLFNRNDVADNWTLHRPAREFGKPAYHVDSAGKLALHGAPVPDYPHMQYLVLAEDGSAQEKPVSFSQRTTLYLRSHVLIWSSLLTAGVVIAAWASNASKAMKKAGSFSQIDYATYLASKHDQARLVALLAELRAVSEQVGARFYVMGEDYPVFLNLAKAADVDVLRAKTCFWEAKVGEQTIVPFDTHWNERGHELYGRCVAKAMLADKILALARPVTATKL